jgi:hypothetical protein
VAYTWNDRQHRCVEETVGWRVFPLLKVWRKLDGGKVALDGRHGHGAVSPWRPKVIVKRVVLDVGVACVVLFGRQRSISC